MGTTPPQQTQRMSLPSRRQRSRCAAMRGLRVRPHSRVIEIVRYGIDSAMLGSVQDTSLLAMAVAIFAAVIIVNYAATWIQDRLIAITGERVIFDLRRAMFAHLQDVSLAFMDKTEVGRMMSRLQGDVNALQEFLENSITVLGDLVLLFGII
ncbi:MAG: ABC transporter transmembrane domain-containing protein, partial [Actinomycetota bacterium]